MNETPVTLSALFKEAHRLEENAKHSAQNQFEATKIWRRSNWWLGAVTAAGSATAGVLTLASSDWTWLVATLAVASAILAAVHTTLKPDKRAEQATVAANRYLEVQGDLRRFRLLNAEDGPGREELREQLAAFAKELASINRDAEPPGRRAYKRAKRNIEKDGGQTHEVDQT